MSHPRLVQVKNWFIFCFCGGPTFSKKKSFPTVTWKKPVNCHGIVNLPSTGELNFPDFWVNSPSTLWSISRDGFWRIDLRDQIVGESESPTHTSLPYCWWLIWRISTIFWVGFHRYGWWCRSFFINSTIPIIPWIVWVWYEGCIGRGSNYWGSN